MREWLPRTEHPGSTGGAVSATASTGRPDVLVVGGGILGAATAYYLARHHRLRVTLLESRYPASGSTGRCICGVRQQFSNEPTINMAIQSVRLFSAMAEELETDVEWAATGYLFLAHDQQQLQRYRDIAPLQRRLGVPVELLGQAEVSEVVPEAALDGLLGAAWCPTDGQANPFRVVYGYLKMLRRFGGTVHTGAHVSRIEVDATGRVGKVHTNDGQVFSAGAVLLATGPQLAQTAALAGVHLPVRPERHEAVITEPTRHKGLPMLVDYRDGGCYFTRLAHTGQIIGCVTPVPAVLGLSVDSTLQFLCQVADRILKLMPGLGQVRVLRQWAGSYEMTPDGNPVAGPTEVDGLWVLGGMCGHGFMLGPAMGQLMARWLSGRGEPPEPLGSFGIGRDFAIVESLR